MAEGTQRILVVEDEPALAESVQFALEREGYEVLVAADGEAAVERFRADHPALVLLDLMLPKVPGLDVCRTIRAESDVPIVIVTAKDAEADKVAGLELGADDYVTKPFSTRELISRIRAHLRRAGMRETAPELADVLHGGPVELDVARHEARVRGQRVDLPPKEWDLLELLVRRKGRLVTREAAIDEVWGPSYVGDTRTLDVHVKRLREKVEEDPRNPAHLVTVRGIGYRFLDQRSEGSG